MTVNHCICLVEESEKNKWKSSKYEKEWPKNEGKMAKCANCGHSKVVSEKGEKKSEASKIITSTIAQHRAPDTELKASWHARCRLSHTRWSLFWAFFWRVLFHSYTFKRGNYALSQELWNMALGAWFYNFKWWF